MKMVKSLILGSAAGLIAMSGAQAADLPVKAKAVEYVRICSLYGAGFYYMPGTDTCIKFGGYLRADTSIAAGDYSFQQTQATQNQGSNNRLNNYWYARARMDFTVDTRTATEYGVLRTFADMVFSYDSTSVTGSSPSNYGTSGAASLGLYHAFIQFAGFTFGRTVSAFDAPWQSYPAGGPDTLPGGSNHVTGIDQVTYTAQFGNGTSATISVQDPTTLANGQAALWNTAVAPTIPAFVLGSYGANDGGGTRSPDIIGAFTVDQAWGLFKFSAAAHDIHPAYYGTTELTGHPSDKWGWAAQAALTIKNIPTGPGDVINVQAVYTDGASKYNFQSLFPAQFAMFSGSGNGAYQSIGFASVADGVFGAGTGIETVKTWGFRGGYTHNWNEYWASAIYGAYGALQYGNSSKVAICANVAAAITASSTAVAGCNPDFNIAAIGFNTVWTPVKGFAFTADIVWTRLDQKYSGNIFIPGIASAAKPTAFYELKDQNSVSALLRAQRNF